MVLVRISTANMLNDLGYQVSEAASAEEALKLVDVGAEADHPCDQSPHPGTRAKDRARRSQTRQAPSLMRW
jgi:CheY-like chemotaxis protein